MALLYTYYGDDFTGSTDVLEQLGSNGIAAVLFLGTPSPSHLEAFPNVQVIGIAGDSRSQSPEWMSQHLPAAFEALKRFDAPVTHYKVCSTFDSSPTVGNIGRAIEIGEEVFSPEFVPVVVGAPHLGRYVAFGNLFAADADGIVRRIDRHSMGRHPVTPMHEADLRLHLAAQSRVNVGHVDVSMLRSGGSEEAIASQVTGGAAAILFDTVDSETQGIVGEILWSMAQRRGVFAVGSSGLTAALISAWRRAGLVPDPPGPVILPEAKPLLIVSGSCSEKTQRQIRWALAHGYRGVALDPAALMDRTEGDYDGALQAACEALESGTDTVIYTALGPTEGTAPGSRLGVELGLLLGDLLGRTRAARTPIHRVVICGGDTSSHAVQQLDLYALTWVANLQPGGPLCRAHADSELDGLELVLKGGQVGTDDFFDVVRGG
jgi:3-oxoisoapionate kinase